MVYQPNSVLYHCQNQSFPQPQRVLAIARVQLLTPRDCPQLKRIALLTVTHTALGQPCPISHCYAVIKTQPHFSNLGQCFRANQVPEFPMGRLRPFLWLHHNSATPCAQFYSFTLSTGLDPESPPQGAFCMLFFSSEPISQRTRPTAETNPQNQNNNKLQPGYIHLLYLSSLKKNFRKSKFQKIKTSENQKYIWR